MVVQRRRRGPFLYRKIWFAQKPQPSGPFTMYAQYLGEQPPAFFVRERFLTVHSPLDADPEAFLERMRKNVAYEVRRCDKDSPTWVEEGDRARFLGIFNAFAAVKSLPQLGTDHLESLGDRLWITRVDLKGVSLAYHAYVVDPDLGRARLLYSASALDFPDRSALGRANRWLHWRDMIVLCERGFTLYDWGGITEPGSDPEREGITQFKLGFGGRIVEEPHYYSPALFLARRLRGLE